MSVRCKPVVPLALLDTLSRHFEAAVACSFVIEFVFQIHRIWYKLSIRPIRTNLHELKNERIVITSSITKKISPTSSPYSFSQTWDLICWKVIDDLPPTPLECSASAFNQRAMHLLLVSIVLVLIGGV